MSGAHAHALVERFKIRSRFADLDVSPENVVSFADGLPGYENSRQFVLLDLEDLAPLKVLHAVNESDPCFLVVDPKSAMPTYRCELGRADRLRLGVRDEKALVWLAIVTVRENGDVVMNLRAPIVINPERMAGRQVMPNNCAYPLQYVIERPA